MRNLRYWKAFAFLGTAFGLVLILLFALAHPVTSRAATSAPAMLPLKLHPASLVRKGNDETASFSVRLKGETIPYRVFGLFVMPGERVLIQAASATNGVFDVVPSGGTVESSAPDGWYWTAPEIRGLYPIRVIDRISEDTITLNAFVLVPYERQESLDGYRIGRYQQTSLSHDPNYAAPEGFVEVTQANLATRIAPHFTLGQFVAKQSSGYPKYLVLQEKLLLKLELLLDSVQARGIQASTFRVMSGYRTPWYNRSIGNHTTYSRHLYGDAADIFIDENGDGRMDDLNGDHRINKDDARYLAGIVEQVSATSPLQKFIGGLGLYRSRATHGPFIHVDVRGVPTRWEGE